MSRRVSARGSTWKRGEGTADGATAAGRGGAGARLLVGEEVVGGHAVVDEARLVRGRDDPVAQRRGAEPDRREQRRVALAHGVLAPRGRCILTAAGGPRPAPPRRRSR